MKSKWLAALLILSLAANLAELVWFGVGFVRRRVELQRFFGWVQNGAPRWNLRPLVDSYRPAWDSLGRLRSAADDELESLAEQEPADSVRIAAAVERLAAVDVAMVRLVFQSVRALERPEYAGIRAGKLRAWRGMTGLAQDSTGRRRRPTS